MPVGTSLLEAAHEGALPRGERLRRRLRLLDVPRLRDARARELLSEQEDDEADILDKAFDVRADSRLGCQSKIERDGDIEVEITRESLEAYENEHPAGARQVHGPLSDALSAFRSSKRAPLTARGYYRPVHRLRRPRPRPARPSRR